MTTLILCTYILKFSTVFKTKILKMLLSTHLVDVLVGCVACVGKPQEVVQGLLSQEQTFPEVLEQNKGLTQSEGFCLVLCPFLLLSSTLHLNKY